MNNIDKDPLLLKYFRKRHVVESTQRIYIYHFQKYYKATGLTPTEAIKEADDEEENRIRLKRRSINDHLDDFELYLEDQKYSELHIKNSIKIIRAFYTLNSIELPPYQRRPLKTAVHEELIDLPNIDDIKRALSFANVKYQAMIILMASSGMRQGDCRNLRLKNFVDCISEYIKIDVNELTDMDHVIQKFPEQIGPLTWHYQMQKNRQFHTCFSTPESLDYILAYLHHQPPKKPEEDTFLFRNPKDREMHKLTVNVYFRRLNGICQFPISANGYIYFRPHNLRKWFGNQLKKTDLGYLETRILMGHEIQDDTGQRYLKDDYEDLKKRYYRNMDEVTIYGKVEVHDLTDEKVKKLEERMNKLERENKILKAHREDEKRK